MEAKKTIAILGLEQGLAKPFLDKLANNNRLLIVSKDISDCAKVSDYLPQERPQNEVELINCPKDGCWEADIIMLWNPLQYKEDEIARLQSVATQKIVLIITKQEEDSTNFPLFPHSKIVILTLNLKTREASIHGKDREAIESINELINKTEYLTLK